MKKLTGKTYENVVKEELKNMKVNQNCPIDTQKILKSTIINIAKTTIGKYQMANNIIEHPQIRQKRKQRKYLKNEYKLAFEKNDKNKKIALNKYRNSQRELKRTEHHITENTEKGLKTWNIVRQMKRNNSEDLIAIKDDKGNRLFSEREIKLHKMNYYKELYTKRDIPKYNQQWTNFINNQMKKYLTNVTSNQEDNNKDITLTEVK